MQKIGGIMVDLNEFGWNESYRIKENDGKLYGRVIEIQRSVYKVICQYGEVNAKLKGSFYKNNGESIFPVVGDFVELRYEEHGDSVINKVCKRKTQFSRTDFSGHVMGYVKTVKEQVLCANFDYIFIFSSLNKDFNIKKITRYISAAVQGGAKPVVVLTKADICENPECYIEQVKNASKAAEVICISSKTGYGLEKVSEYMMSGKTIVLVGSSGVGKSTLVNTIIGEEVMATSGIRESDSAGHHTTTHRQLWQLGSKGMIIDTPGIREVGMWDAEDGINDTFSDIAELISACKFRNCNHKNEPGCAVKKALAEGTLSEKRWQMYCELQEENQFGLKKAAYTKKEKLKAKINAHSI